MQGNVEEKGYILNRKSKIVITKILEYHRCEELEISPSIPRRSASGEHIWFKHLRYGAAKDEPLQPGSKIVYLIRHGQSTANVAKLNNIPRSDPEKFRDAPLSPLGITQAHDLALLIANWKIQVALTSPLRRAMATASYAFSRCTTPIFAWKDLSEFYPNAFENQGLTITDPKVQSLLKSLPRDIVTEGIPKQGYWWSTEFGYDRTRLKNVIDWITISPYTRIALVTHWGVIRQFLDYLHFTEEFSIPNAAPIEIHLKGPIPVIDFTEYSIQVLPSVASRRRNSLLVELDDFLEEYLKINDSSSSLDQYNINRQMSLKISQFHPIEKKDKIFETLNSFTSNFKQQSRRWKPDKSEIIITPNSIKLKCYSRTLMKLSNCLERLDEFSCTKNILLKDFEIVILQKVNIDEKTPELEEDGQIDSSNYRHLEFVDGKKYPLLFKIFSDSKLAMTKNEEGEKEDGITDYLKDVNWNLAIVSKEEGEINIIPFY